MAQETIFDKILRKEIPCQMVFEDEWVFAFRDIHPQAPTHVLVIPKIKSTCFSSFATLDPLLLGHFLKGIAQVALKLGLKEDGYRVVFNDGKDGGQTVDYVHAHILGGRHLGWPPG